MRRITISITDEMFDAVVALADREMRAPKDQLVWLIKEGLERESDLPVDRDGNR